MFQCSNPKNAIQELNAEIKRCTSSWSELDSLKALKLFNWSEYDLLGKDGQLVYYLELVRTMKTPDYKSIVAWINSFNRRWPDNRLMWYRKRV